MIPLYDDNPSRIQPYVTYALIAACVLAFLWQLSLGDAVNRAIYSFGVIPAVLFDSKQLPPELVEIPTHATVFTSMFLHGGWMHLLGNMLYLWIFGNNVEDAMGHVRFISFYLICGVVAVLAHALPNPDSVTPMIGASGAISGVLGAYLLLHPRARVMVGIPLGFFLYTIWLPAGAVLGVWFALQIFSSIGAGDGPGVAWYAHIGGFICGMVLLPMFKLPGVRLFNPPHRRQEG